MPGGDEAARNNNEKLSFVRYLAGRGVNVACPQLSINGRLTEVVTSGQDSFIVSSENVVPCLHLNTHNPLEWNEAFFFRWGQIIGQSHECTTSYLLWRKADALAPKEPPTQIHDWNDEWQSFNEWCQEDVVRERWHEIRNQLAKLPIEPNSYGLIHNDPHLWNILVEGSRLTLIDFDLAGYHWFMMDLGIAIYTALCLAKPEPTVDFNQYTTAFLKSFLGGYRTT